MFKEISIMDRAGYLCLLLIAFMGLLAAEAPTLRSEEVSDEGLSFQDLGGTYHFDPIASSIFLPVGCLDHRTLMFIVHEVDGSEPQTPKMLAERDCRPLLKDTDYIRCGPGGYAHPSRGDPVTYSAYCRKGGKDLQLYVLDLQMNKVK